MKKNIPKIFFPAISILFIAIAFWPQPALAKLPPQPWPDLIAQSYKKVLDKIEKEMDGAILGALKTAAAEMINETVDNLISGGSAGSGGAAYVQDWDDELFYKPMKEAEVFVEGYLTSQLKAKASDYSASTQMEAQGIVKNYGDYLKNFAKSNLKKSGENQKKISYDSCENPNRPLGQGDFRCWLETAGQPIKLSLDAQKEAMAHFEKEQKKAEVQAIAYQGFKARKQGGQVVTPGSTLKDIESDAKDLGNKIIAGATKWQEVVTALVTKIVVKTAKHGIGMAQRNIQREINANIRSVRSDIDRQIQTSGAGSVFKPRF